MLKSSAPSWLGNYYDFCQFVVFFADSVRTYFFGWNENSHFNKESTESCSNSYRIPYIPSVVFL